MSSPIPAFYRICFTVIDPILTTVGLLCNIFAPVFIVEGYTPHAITPLTPETLILLDTTAGFLACILFLTLVLQRARPADVGLWRMLHFGIMLAEVAMLVGLEEWNNIGITGTVAIIRAAFCLGIEMSGRKLNFDICRGIENVAEGESHPRERDERGEDESSSGTPEAINGARL
ncbi:hypothetical protein B0H11DRAFT_2246117 [Mycena galericulata]|nr:hypothetical protein B0H11DRAFT_2246117 [Mycena galericulata]